MPACTDTEYVDRTYYRHLKSKPRRDSPDEQQVDLSSAVITVNPGKSRNPLHRHAGYSMDLSGQDIAHIVPLPPFSKVSTSKMFINPSLFTLTHLKLSNNLLNSIPDNIGSLESLVHLDISNNRIRSLPKSIRSLSNLTILQARNNLLRELPQEIGQLSSLSVLDISHNRITVLPAEILSLSNLCHLITTRCPLISAIPKPHTARTLSLLETCARTVVRHRIPLDADVPSHIKSYVASAKECSMCCKPCYEGAIDKYMLHERQPPNPAIPVKYTLCSAHWNQAEEIVLSMFSTVPSPSLHHYIAENGLSDQDNHTPPMMVEPASTNHRASLVSPMVHQRSHSKRSLWQQTAKLWNRPISR
ncbi:hypothetical protein BC943DRAFT_377918 [Umbelopsis sp. AD052]|nr:hypothetical protein BC943DRAFT_377918 [Umbelopsis sp. AD052]